MLNRKQLKSKIPFGYGKEIAKRAGVTQKHVSDYLNGRANSERVEMAVLEVLAELNTKKKILLQQIAA
jgi:transcriptional regulator with XRE-family HTH domain